MSRSKGLCVFKAGSGRGRPSTTRLLLPSLVRSYDTSSRPGSGQAESDLARPGQARPPACPISLALRSRRMINDRYTYKIHSRYNTDERSLVPDHIENWNLKSSHLCCRRTDVLQVISDVNVSAKVHRGSRYPGGYDMMGSLDEMRTLKRNRRDTYRHPRRPSRKLGSGAKNNRSRSTSRLGGKQLSQTSIPIVNRLT